MVEMNPCIICTKFLSVSAAKVSDGHKVFFVASLSCGLASLATSGKRNWRAPWQPHLRSRGFRTASCLDAAAGWGMGMSSVVRISQGWDVLRREPGLGKVLAPT